MAFTEKNLARQAVNNTGEILYTVPASTKTAVKDINMANTGATDCYVSIWLVPNGSSRTNENILIPQMNVPANNIRHWSGFQVLNNTGDTIQAISEINDQIAVTISGAELT